MIKRSNHEAHDEHEARVGRIQRVFMFFMVVFFLTVPSSASAQTVTDGRVWAGVTLQTTFSPAWRMSIEIIGRSRDGVSELDLAAFRPTILYAVSERSSIGGGYLVSPSFPAAGGTTIEQRVFGQYLFTAPALGGSVSLRTRLEARFIEGNSGTLGRIRQQVRYSRQLGRGPVSVVASEELMVHLNDTSRSPRGVDQNRLFAGLSVAAGRAARIEAGYVNQFSPGHRGAADRMNHVGMGILTVIF
jgi:hypothetical protein